MNTSRKSPEVIFNQRLCVFQAFFALMLSRALPVLRDVPEAQRIAAASRTFTLIPPFEFSAPEIFRIAAFSRDGRS
jgi:hypothetical protein